MFTVELNRRLTLISWFLLYNFQRHLSALTAELYQDLILQLCSGHWAITELTEGPRKRDTELRIMVKGIGAAEAGGVLRVARGPTLEEQL